MNTAENEDAEPRGLRVYQIALIGVVVIAVGVAIAARARPNAGGDVLPGPEPTSALVSPQAGSTPPTLAPVKGVIVAPGETAHGRRFDLMVRYLGPGLPNGSTSSSCGLKAVPAGPLGSFYLVAITLTNHTDGPIGYVRSRFALVDPAGRTVTPSDFEGFTGGATLDPRGMVSAGEALTSVLFFDAGHLTSPVRARYSDVGQELSVRFC